MSERSVAPSKDTPEDISGNICGVLIRARPENRTDVAGRLDAIDGVEVHHCNENGQIVVTIEDIEDIKASDTITTVHNVEGVLAASLVYHYSGEDPGQGISIQEKKP